MGDCWFLSAVAVLTEVSRISDVIITPEYNEEGIYTVRFCIQVRKSQLLTSFLPKSVELSPRSFFILYNIINCEIANSTLRNLQKAY